MPKAHEVLQKLADTKLRAFIEKGITSSPFLPTDLVEFSNELFARPDVLAMIRDMEHIEAPADTDLESTRLAHVILAFRALAEKPTAELVIDADGKLAIAEPDQATGCFSRTRCKDAPDDPLLVRGTGRHCCDTKHPTLDAEWHARVQARATQRRTASNSSATMRIFINPGSLDLFSTMKD